MAPFGIPRAWFCIVVQRASFAFSMDWLGGGDLLSPGSDFGIWGQQFGLVTFLGSEMGPEKTEFARESFCGGNQGKFPNPNEFYYI